MNNTHDHGVECVESLPRHVMRRVRGAQAMGLLDGDERTIHAPDHNRNPPEPRERRLCSLFASVVSGKGHPPFLPANDSNGVFLTDDCDRPMNSSLPTARWKHPIAKNLSAHNTSV